MDLNGPADVERALTLLGELLAVEGHEYAITILGGAALNLLGIGERTTSDVDILAFATPNPRDAPARGTLRPPPEPLPEMLTRAAGMVARDLELAPDWLNSGPALQWLAGLPPGLERRVQWHRYAALWVGLVDRYDLIFFKLFAAADSTGPTSVHYQDLLALRPSAVELRSAAAWVETQDASPEFAAVLHRVVTHVRTDLALADS